MVELTEAVVNVDGARPDGGFCLATNRFDGLMTTSSGSAVSLDRFLGGRPRFLLTGEGVSVVLLSLDPKDDSETTAAPFV